MNVRCFKLLGFQVLCFVIVDTNTDWEATDVCTISFSLALPLKHKSYSKKKKPQKCKKAVKRWQAKDMETTIIHQQMNG